MTTAKIAAESLGCSVTEYYAAGDLSAQAGKVAEFGAAGYDIIITTIPDPYLFDDPIASAIANGSTVLGWVDDDYTPNPRQAFVGWENNVRCGQKFASIILPLSPGSRIVYASEDIGATWNHDRHIGLMEALSGMDVNVDVVDLTRDYAVGEERLGSYLEAHPDVVAIVGGDGMGTEVAVKVLESKNIPPGQIKVTGHCMSELSIRGIEEGYIEKAMAASPQTVAQTVVMMAYMMREHGVMGITLEVPWVFVAAEDVPWLKAAYVLPG
jgi:ABC-type sugar transport system substrate-binding protein